MKQSNELSPAVLAHFQLLPADQQAIAVQRLLRTGWSLDDVARVCGLSPHQTMRLIQGDEVTRVDGGTR